MAGHGGRKTEIAARPAMLESLQRVGVAACMKTVTLSAWYDITSAVGCCCDCRHLAAATALSTSLSLHADRLSRPVELSRVRAPGPDPSGVKPFSSTCVPWSLKMPSIFYVTLPAAVLLVLVVHR